MTADNSLECRYLGQGDLNQFRQIPLAENEALIYPFSVSFRIKQVVNKPFYPEENAGLN